MRQALIIFLHDIYSMKFDQRLPATVVKQMFNVFLWGSVESGTNRSQPEQSEGGMETEQILFECSLASVWLQCLFVIRPNMFDCWLKFENKGHRYWHEILIILVLIENSWNFFFLKIGILETWVWIDLIDVKAIWSFVGCWSLWNISQINQGLSLKSHWFEFEHPWTTRSNITILNLLSNHWQPYRIFFPCKTQLKPDALNLNFQKAFIRVSIYFSWLWLWNFMNGNLFIQIFIHKFHDSSSSKSLSKKLRPWFCVIPTSGNRRRLMHNVDDLNNKSTADRYLDNWLKMYMQSANMNKTISN